MPGQVVVVTGMMIVGIDSTVDRVNEREMMSLLCRHWQMLAQLNARRGSGNRIERATIFQRRIRFHIPRIKMRCPTTQEEQDRRFGLSTFGRITGRRCGQRWPTKLHSRKAHARRNEKRATIYGLFTCTAFVCHLFPVCTIPISDSHITRINSRRYDKRCEVVLRA